MVKRSIPVAGRRYRTIHFAALGCSKNRVDTEVLAGIAANAGLEVVADPGEAEVIVVSTCGFIEAAARESIDTLLELSRFKETGRCRLLVAASCLVQRHGAELADGLPEVDLLVGTQEPSWLERALAGAAAARLEVGAAGHFLQGPSTPRLLEPRAASAYVKIADGCSRACAFCAIPAIRGPMRSRAVDGIVAEARALVARGVKELVLVSQDTAAYGRDRDDGAGLVSLVRALDRVDGLAWVRLLYLYPDGVTDDLLACMRDLRTLVPYLDVPVQHASAEVLRRMRRGHGPARLRRLVERARRIVPGIFLRTTVLVGHPGERDEDFAELLGFVGESRFDRLGVFRYSDEEGTPSFGTGPVVSPRISYARQRRVLAVQRRISRELGRALVGSKLDVLVERAADDAGWVLEGRHPGQAPEVDGITYLVDCAATPGAIVRARVTRATDHDLVAEPITSGV
ncbi:MAG TPA: 30S ribosomal protein S12 methylthiotransferase RimO [Polyangia bacterium]|nr:30S ribosomal protein S12 methylthiotransferase RimO [Polyangia bacterium]